jgi:uncharacterized protein (DUF1499 family)
MTFASLFTVLKKFLRKILIVSFVMVFGLAMLSYFSSDPPLLGVSNGRLSECTNSTNCVSSMSEIGKPMMDPIPFFKSESSSADAPTADLEHSLASQTQRLKEVIAANFPRATLIQEDKNYLRYEFQTFVFRFVDDVEFLIDAGQKVIHFRSASRVGRSDLGKNRKRMLAIGSLMSE